MHTRPKYDEKCKNKVILLMITDGKKWHYLAVKSSPALFRGRTSNHKEEFYWLHCFHSYSTKKNKKNPKKQKKTLKTHTNVCKNHGYCYLEMPKEDNEILKYNHGENSLKVPFIIHAGLES